MQLCPLHCRSADCELQHSHRQVMQFSRQKSRRLTLIKSLKIHRVLVYTDTEGISGWWTYGFYVADAAIGLRLASKNKEMWTKKRCVF